MSRIRSRFAERWRRRTACSTSRKPTRMTTTITTRRRAAKRSASAKYGGLLRRSFPLQGQAEKDLRRRLARALVVDGDLRFERDVHDRLVQFHDLPEPDAE